MTKKHFIALADVIRETEKGITRGLFSGEEAKELYRINLAAFCASLTPRFKRERWLAYIADECGPNGGRK